MVLSEVAKAPHDDVRIECLNVWGGVGRAVTSRFTEVTTTTVPAGHRQPGGPDQELMRCYLAGFAWPQSNNVPSTQMQWRITAIFRAMATFAFFTPVRFASFIPQALREDHFFVR